MLEFARKRFPLSLLSGLLGLLLGCSRSGFTQPQPGDVRHPDWTSSAVIYEVNVRQYTPEGTLNAFAAHLPRLRNMGVDILWLMPIHPIGELHRKGTLGSYYSVRDYLAVNPEFGTLDDLKRLVSQAHGMGMHVILDWVANHCAWDNPLVTEHPNWFTHDSTGAMIPPVPDWSDVVDLNYDSPELRRYMIDALKFWIREADIDGYRCDVAGMMPMDFWNDARRELTAMKPVFMLAEDENPLCHEHAFDMTYAWSLHHLLRDVAHGSKTVGDLRGYYGDDARHYPPSAIRMRFTDNHDENSWNGAVQTRMGGSVEQFAVLTFLIPGMPLIYTGQEAGLDRPLKFFDKDTVNWSQLPNEQLYTTLSNLKAAAAELAASNDPNALLPIRTDQDSTVFAFARSNGSSRVLAVLNISDSTRIVRIQDRGIDGSYVNVFDQSTLDLSSSTELTLRPRGYWVARKR